MTDQQPTRSTRQSKGVHRGRTDIIRPRAAAGLRRVALAQLIGAFLLAPAAAGQKCWPVEELKSARAEQGKDVIATYDSWMREKSMTIIYRDPADGVVTAVAVDTNGTACTFDMGQTPADEEQGGPRTRDYLERHPI